MIRVGHVITRFIVGGAQENTLLSVVGTTATGRHEVDLITGPTFGPEGTLVPDARRLGVEPMLVSSLRRELNPVLDPVALMRLKAIFARRRYDVVHTHSSKAGILGRVAARMAGVPVVIHTSHGWAFNEFQSPPVRAMYAGTERFCARLCDMIITVTSRLTEKGLRHGVGHPDQYVEIRSGIDLERYATPTRSRADVCSEFGIPEDVRIVGSVMRLSPPKEPLVFVDAAAQILREAPDTHFIIVGDGLLRRQTEERIRERNLTDRFHLAGLRHDVPDFLGVFDIFVLPTQWEGLPRVLPQAMAAGLPVVASEVDGNAEIVKPGVNGFLVPPGESREMAEASLRLLRDPDLVLRMGHACRESAEPFDVRRMVDDITDLYDRVLRQKSVDLA